MAAYTVQCYLPLPLARAYNLVMVLSPHPFAIHPAARLMEMGKKSNEWLIKKPACFCSDASYPGKTGA